MQLEKDEFVAEHHEVMQERRPANDLGLGDCSKLKLTVN